MKTLLETLRGGADYLGAKGVEDARLNMEHLLAKVLGCRRLDLYMEFERPMAEGELGPLRELLRRRAAREPLQHLLGEVEFLGRRFASDSRALIPRPETEELVGLLLGRYRGSGAPAKVADVGCGSGVIGLSLAAEWEGAQVSLVDLSAEALALAGENAARLGLEAPRVLLVEGDLMAPLAGEFDLVVANLPYVATGEIPELQPELSFDPVLALDGGEVGTALIRRLIADLPGRLAPGGLFALEVGEGQSDGLLGELAEAGLCEPVGVKDLAGVERFLLARR